MLVGVQEGEAHVAQAATELEAAQAAVLDGWSAHSDVVTLGTKAGTVVAPILAFDAAHRQTPLRLLAERLSEQHADSVVDDTSTARPCCAARRTEMPMLERIFALIGSGLPLGARHSSGASCLPNRAYPVRS